MRTRYLLAPIALALAAPAANAAPARTPVAASPDPTRILDRKTAERLRENKGVTLQWIDWDTRGSVFVSVEDGVWKLRGAQAGGSGRLFLDGIVTEIGKGYFTFAGKIEITDTPDEGRQCEKGKTWHFAVTQNRPYFRLREFEWCDYLTDYIDIHF